MADIELIRKIKTAAYTEGDFTTRAGKKTNYYIDKYLFSCQPDILKPLCDALIQILPSSDTYDRLMAPALGAIAIASPIAKTLNKPLLVFEKDGEDVTVHGSYSPGERILVIEDVLTTGSTVLDLCQHVNTIPLTVVEIISVIDRQEGAFENIAKHGIKSRSLITAMDLKNS